MRISLNLTTYATPDATGGQDRAGLTSHLECIVGAADNGGLDTVWVSDHLIQAEPGRSADEDMLEAYSTLGFLAGRTERIRLGTMVTAVTYRSPTLLIKAVTTLDVLSGGRAWFGVGAGYQQDEALAMDLFLPPMADRFGQLEETLQLALQMWSGDTSGFDGVHCLPQRPHGNPRPVSRPHPPILIGGMGERRTLPLVARYADACNLFDIPDGGRTLTRKLEVLARHCEAVGRPYEEVEKTVSTRLGAGESAASFARRCDALRALGFEHVVVIPEGPWTEEAVATLAEAPAA